MAISPIGSPQANPRRGRKSKRPAYARSRNDILRTANALVDLQTRPTLNALDREFSRTQAQGLQMQNRVTQLYAGLGDVYNRHGQTARTAGDAAVGQLKALGDAQLAATKYEQAPDARGPGLDGGSSKALAAQMADAQARAAGTTANATTAAIAEGGSYQNLIQAMAAAAPTRGAEEAAQVGNRTQDALMDLKGKRADVLMQRGPLRAKTVQDLTQQGFNNYATLRALELDEDKLAQDLAMGNAGMALDAMQTNASIADDNIDNAIAGARLENDIADDAADNARDERRVGIAELRAQAAAEGKASLTPYQQLQLRRANNRTRGDIRAAYSKLNYLRDKFTDEDGNKLKIDEIRLALQKQFKDEDVVDAAFDLRHNRKRGGRAMLSSRTIKNLQNRGIGVPGRWKSSAPKYKAPRNDTKHDLG